MKMHRTERLAAIKATYHNSFLLSYLLYPKSKYTK